MSNASRSNDSTKPAAKGIPKERYFTVSRTLFGADDRLKVFGKNLATAR